MSGALLEVAMSKKRPPMWRGADFQVKMHKAHHSRTTFGSWDVKKVYAAVARRTFPSQNVQSTPFLDHFWKRRCRKRARRFGAKHIFKHYVFGALLGVQMSKKVRASTFSSQNGKNTTCSDHFWKVRSRKSGRQCGAKHIWKSKVSKTADFWAFFDVQMSKNCRLTNLTLLTIFTNLTS